MKGNGIFEVCRFRLVPDDNFNINSPSLKTWPNTPKAPSTSVQKQSPTPAVIPVKARHTHTPITHILIRPHTVPFPLFRLTARTLPAFFSSWVPRGWLRSSHPIHHAPCQRSQGGKLASETAKRTDSGWHAKTRTVSPEPAGRKSTTAQTPRPPYSGHPQTHRNHLHQYSRGNIRSQPSSLPSQRE